MLIYETKTSEHLCVVTFNTFAPEFFNIRGRKIGVCLYIIYLVCNNFLFLNHLLSNLHKSLSVIVDLIVANLA